MKRGESNPLVVFARRENCSAPGLVTTNLFGGVSVRLLVKAGVRSASLNVAVAPFGRSSTAGCAGGATYFEPMVGRVVKNPAVWNLPSGVGGRDQWSRPSKSVPSSPRNFSVPKREPCFL